MVIIGKSGNMEKKNIFLKLTTSSKEKKNTVEVLCSQV